MISRGMKTMAAAVAMMMIFTCFAVDGVSAEEAEKAGSYVETDAGNDISVKEASDDKSASGDKSFAVKADYMNRYADVRWSKVKGASYYVLYRKVGAEEKKWTTVLKTKKCSYRDVYSRFKTKAQRRAIKKGMYIDPSLNRIRYTVAAYRSGKRYKTTKNGCCNVVTPVIIDVKRNDSKVTVTWGRVFNAVKFRVYGASADENGNKKWKLYKIVNTASKEKQSASVSVTEDVTWFGVQAVFSYNGGSKESGYEKNFTTVNRHYSKSKMAVIGDSIPYGAPYKDKERRGLYTYPHRVGELTDMKVSNKSVGGAIYPKVGNIRSLLSVAEKMDFSKYDVVLMTAGSNDYFYNIKLGSLKSTNVKNENGAINRILKMIKKGNKVRIEKEKEPTKIVFVDLFYSNRAGKVFGSRFKTKNGIGLTLTDYQNNINKLIKKYKKEGLSVYRFSHNAVTGSNYRHMLTDDIHLSKLGYAKVGNMLSEFLIKKGIISYVENVPETEEDTLLMADIPGEL